MITNFVRTTKKAPSQQIRTRRKMHTAVPPEFRLKANTLIGDNGALPYWVTSIRVSPICSKGKCTTQRFCVTHSSVTLSVKTYFQVGELYHRILYKSISHFFCFCKRFFKKR